jgi:hypothetical protein
MGAVRGSRGVRDGDIKKRAALDKIVVTNPTDKEVRSPLVQFNVLACPNDAG